MSGRPMQGDHVSMGTGGPDLSAHRWRRWGHDRVYVDDASGKCLGWLDLQTDKQRVLSPAHKEAVQQMLMQWLRDHPSESSAEIAVADATGEDSVQASSPEPHVATRANANADYDLASNLSGQSVRARAIEEQEKRPVMTWLARLLGVHTDERAWRVGEWGENHVAAELARLNNQWHHIHSITVPDRDTDIDHLVIGPPGVFSLNTKHHIDAVVWVAGDNLYVNSRPTSYIRASRSEARRVSKILSAASGMRVEARGVVVVVNARSFVIKEPPRDVAVVYRMQLVDWLTSQPAMYPDSWIEQVFAIARRSSTWTG